MARIIQGGISMLSRAGKMQSRLKGRLRAGLPTLQGEVQSKLKVMYGRVFLTFAIAAVASAQTVCPPTPEFTPCDLVFDIPSAMAISQLICRLSFVPLTRTRGL